MVVDDAKRTMEANEVPNDHSKQSKVENHNSIEDDGPNNDKCSVGMPESPMSVQDSLKSDDNSEVENHLNSFPGARFGNVRERSPSNSSNSEEEGTQNDEQKRQKVSTPIPVPGFIIPGVSASPPNFVSLEQIMKAANAVSRMALAHEIAVNRDFKLEKVDYPENSWQKQVKQTMHKAFWDLLQADLDDNPPLYQHAIVLLTEIKEILLSLLLPHHTKLHEEICEVLDIDLIKQQTEKGVLDFHYYAQYIISVMSKLCAPVRDEQIRELMMLGDVVPLFRGILEVLDLMKLDMANFHIQMIRPHLQQQSIEYEKAKFAEYMELQDDGLICTRQWLKRNADKLMEAQLQNDSVATLGATSPAETLPSTAAILTASYMDLLQWNKDNEFPETLIMDQARFLDLCCRVDFVALVATIMLVTYSTVGSAISGISEFKEQLKNHLMVLLEGYEKTPDLKDVLKNVAIQVLKEVNECLLKHGFEELSVDREHILAGQIKEIADSNHKVRLLVKTRILEFVELVLASSTASPIKIPPGLSVMQMELSRITGQFLRLVSHNRAVFGCYYGDIITSIRKGTCDITPKAVEASSDQNSVHN